MATGKGKRRLSFKVLLLIVVVALVSVLLLEGLLRGYVAITTHLRSLSVNEAHLDSYEMVDPQNKKTWVLRPGYKITAPALMEEKEREGKELGAAAIEEGATKYGYDSDDILFQVNKFGFKGPDIEKSKDANTLRIMAIGDSTTFGFVDDRYSYPRTLERYLRSQGVSVEMINAGVEGYATEDVLYHLDYFMSFQPDIAIIYIGWNDLYGDIFLPDIYIVRAFNKLYRYFQPKNPDWQVEGGRLKFSDHYYDSFTKEALHYASSYQPSFSSGVREVVEEFSEEGIKPVLVTLPGLFSVDRQPAPEALQIGHLPGNGTNAYVLAVMTNTYNNAIRQLATEENIPLIDLEEWSNQVLVPPEQWFSDSVHLSLEGQSAIGNYLGERLLELGLVSLEASGAPVLAR